MRSGLNLIEVLVAVAILAVLFVPVFDVFQSGVQTTKYTEDRLRALTIGAQQIEAVRHAASINRKSLEAVVRGHLLAGGFQPYVIDNRYRVETTVDPDFKVNANGSEAFVCKVRVKVDWQLSGDERTLSLETLVDRAYE